MVSYDDRRPPRPPVTPYGHGLASSYFFCACLSYDDVELLCDIHRVGQTATGLNRP